MSRLFRWICPSCRTVLSVVTEEDWDDDLRGVDSTGCFGYGPRCPMCATQMAEEDDIAIWHFSKNRTSSGVTLDESHFEQWRSEQPESKHDDQCEVYSREDARCGCDHDRRMKNG